MMMSHQPANPFNLRKRISAQLLQQFFGFGWTFYLLILACRRRVLDLTDMYSYIMNYGSSLKNKKSFFVYSFQCTYCSRKIMNLHKMMYAHCITTSIGSHCSYKFCILFFHKNIIILLECHAEHKPYTFFCR